MVALVKPWALWSTAPGDNGAGATRPGAASQLSASATPPASPTPLPLDPYAMDCLSGDTEQTVTLERWPDKQVRTWVATDGALATGPLDARMPRIVIHSSHVIGLGVCASRALAGPVGPAARVRDIQSITGTGAAAKALEIGAPDPITRDIGTADGAVLYGGIIPQTSFDEPAPLLPWPPGSYAIAFTFPMDPGQEVHWLRVDIVADPRPQG